MFNYWRTPKCFFMLHIAPIFSGECFLSFFNRPDQTTDLLA